MSPKRKAAGKKAAATRKRQAAKKAAAKTKHRAAGKKAAKTRVRKAAAKKAAATRTVAKMEIKEAPVTAPAPGSQEMSAQAETPGPTEPPAPGK